MQNSSSIQQERRKIKTMQNFTINNSQQQLIQKKRFKRTIKSAFPSGRKLINALQNRRSISNYDNENTKSIIVYKNDQLDKLSLMFSELKQKDQFISQGIFSRTLNDQFNIKNQFKPAFTKQASRKNKKILSFHSKDQYNNPLAFLNNYSVIHNINSFNDKRKLHADNPKNLKAKLSVASESLDRMKKTPYNIGIFTKQNPLIITGRSMI